jgi:FixJ family two-component response regulator
MADVRQPAPKKSYKRASLKSARRMDGIKTAAQLLALGVRTIFATGHANPEIVARGDDANPLASLFKPCSEQVLLRAVAQASG